MIGKWSSPNNILSLGFSCVSVWVCVCVRVHVYIRIYKHIKFAHTQRYTYATWRSEVNLRCHSLGAFHFAFWNKVFQLAWTSSIRLGCLDSVFQICLSLPQQCWTYTGIPPCLDFLAWVPRIECRSSYLHGKHFTKSSSQPKDVLNKYFQMKSVSLHWNKWENNYINIKIRILSKWCDKEDTK